MTNFTQPVALYDLDADPHEDRNIADKEPKTVTRQQEVISRGGKR